MTGHITIGERDVDAFSGEELKKWCLSQCTDYAPWDSTLELWIGVLRHIDQVGPPVTVRQLFYGLASIGLVEKSEAGYRQVQRVVLLMRRQGALPYDFVADNTRIMRKPSTYTGLEAYLKEGAKGYRRALWANQDAYVEVWCEKDALAGVIVDVTEPWDVPLMVSRGFASESYLWNASEAIKEHDKPAYVYYLGDHDHQGVLIPEKIKSTLANFGATFTFERVAVLPWQIERWNLPTRPAKASAMSNGWQGRCVDLDAIPADKLRDLVQDCITRHIDEDSYKSTLKAERLERETLKEMVESFD